jgi:Asp-tRNA(Asn)/Glu-tRNA(Gln) amidotransferase A subunit family amidase
LTLYAESAAAFDRLTIENRDDELVRQERFAWPNFFRLGQTIPAVSYIQANRQRALLIDRMAELFTSIDVYVSPSFGGGNLAVTNMTGHPCVVIPNGLIGEDGNQPVSITFIGDLFGEAEVLALAKAYQEATEHDEQRPPRFR